MKQAIFHALPPDALPPEDPRVSPRTLLTPFSRRMGLFLTAALLMILVSVFAFASPAHASGGDCWSYNTWSNQATYQDTGTPAMYGNDKNSPRLGLGLNSCQDSLMVKWS